MTSLGHPQQLLRPVALIFALLLGWSQLATAATLSDATPAPEFTLPLVANGEGDISLLKLRGSVVYVDFWASWCGPCRLSLPALDTLYREFGDQGFAVTAVSVDVVEEDALDFLTRYPVSYPVAIDKTGAVPRSYSVNGMPSGYLIDKAGRVRSVHVGFKKGDEAALREEIKALLAE